MTQHRSGLSRVGSRWATDQELRRIRNDFRSDRWNDDAKERYHRALVRRGELDPDKLCLAKAALAIVGAGSWRLPRNNIWNIPDPPTSKVRFQYEKQTEYVRYVGTSILRGLVVDNQGCVYGMRNLLDRRPEGYAIHGRVSIGGKKHGAFTSSRTFERQDGSLVNTEVLILVRDLPSRSLFDEY